MIRERVLGVRQQRAEVAEREDLRRRISEVPCEPVQSRVPGKCRSRRKPVARHVREQRGCNRRRRRKRPNDPSGTVGDRQRQLALCGRRQHVVEHGSLGGIFAGGRLDGQWRVAVDVPPRSNRGRRREQPHIGTHPASKLTKRRHVVQNPQRPAVGGEHEIGAVDGHVAHRRGGQIQLKGLPVIARIRRHVNARFGPAVHQPLLHRVFADEPRERIVRKSRRDLRPARSRVDRAVDVRPNVVRRDVRRKRGPRVVASGVDDLERAIGRHILAATRCARSYRHRPSLDEAVVRRRPEHAGETVESENVVIDGTCGKRGGADGLDGADPHRSDPG